MHALFSSYPAKNFCRFLNHSCLRVPRPLPLKIRLELYVAFFSRLLSSEFGGRWNHLVSSMNLSVFRLYSYRTKLDVV